MRGWRRRWFGHRWYVVVAKWYMLGPTSYRRAERLAEDTPFTTQIVWR